MTTAGARNPAEKYESCFVPAIFWPLSEPVLAAAKPKRGERVLDLACGTGVVARRLAALVGKQGRVSAVDLRPGMLAVARTLPAHDGLNIDFRQGDATNLDLPDGAFDLVVCQQGLQFFSDRLRALREMRRVTKPGGRIVLAVWQGLDRNDFQRRMAEVELPHLEALGLDRDAATTPFSLGSARELRELCDGAGLGDVIIGDATIEVRFAYDGFVRDVDEAYCAVVPLLGEDPARFDAFVDQVTRESEPLRREHKLGNQIVFPMRTHVVVARA